MFADRLGVAELGLAFFDDAGRPFRVERIRDDVRVAECRPRMAGKNIPDLTVKMAQAWVGRAVRPEEIHLGVEAELVVIKDRASEIQVDARFPKAYVREHHLLRRRQIDGDRSVDELVRVAGRARIHDHVELRVTVYLQLVLRSRNIEKAYQLRIERLVINPGHRLPVTTNCLLLCYSRDGALLPSRARAPCRLIRWRLRPLLGFALLLRFLLLALLLLFQLLDRLAKGLHFFFKLSQLLI